MHSPLVLAGKTLGAPNFASCGHQTGALPPISALPIYPHTATAGDAQMRLPGPLTSPVPADQAARREPAGKELAEPSPASLPAHDRSKGRGPARRLPPLSQPLPALLHEPRAQFRLPPPRSCRQAAPRWREEARQAIGDVPASSWALKRSHRPVAPPSAPPRAATVRPPVLAYTG